MAKGKKKKKVKSKLSSEQKKQLQAKRSHTREIRSTFSTCQFNRIASASDKEFTFDGTKSDFDDIFLYENVVVTCSRLFGPRIT